MRNLLITIGLLTVLFVSACEIDLRPFQNAHSLPSVLDVDPWRRTKDGWEKNINWNLNGKPKAANIHPSLVASFQLLACAGSLLAGAASDPAE